MLPAPYVSTLMRSTHPLVSASLLFSSGARVSTCDVNCCSADGGKGSRRSPNAQSSSRRSPVSKQLNR